MKYCYAWYAVAHARRIYMQKTLPASPGRVMLLDGIFRTQNVLSDSPFANTLG